jgi:hypothetical protein
MDFRFVKLTVFVCIAFFGLAWVEFGDNRRFEDFASGPGTIAFHEGNTLPGIGQKILASGSRMADGLGQSCPARASPASA